MLTIKRKMLQKVDTFIPTAQRRKRVCSRNKENLLARHFLLQGCHRVVGIGDAHAVDFKGRNLRPRHLRERQLRHCEPVLIIGHALALLERLDIGRHYDQLRKTRFHERCPAERDMPDMYRIKGAAQHTDAMRIYCLCAAVGRAYAHVGPARSLPALPRRSVRCGRGLCI